MVAKDFKAELEKLHEKHELERKNFEVVSSGCLMLDLALRKGGIPRGCTVDLFGDEGLGKTTLTLDIMAERVKHKEFCVYIDVEHRLNPDLLNLIIPDQEYFRVYQPKDGDSALAILEGVAKMPDVRMVAIDSMAAIVPAELLEEDAGNPAALAARRITMSIKKVLGPIYANNTIVIMINQMRASLNFMQRGPTKVSTSINALKFLSSIRLQMNSLGVIRDGDRIIGQKIVLTAVKNSFAAPHGKATMTIIYGKGIDKVRDIIDCGVLTGIIEKTGGWLTYKAEGKKGEVEEIKAHGEAELIEKLAPIMPKVTARITEAIKNLKDQIDVTGKD